jgi:predicted RNA-binding Zn-ribbon protein involved in translation (DUF1610 family)
MRRLSDCKPEGFFATCPHCGETFVDDVLVMGSLFCPNCPEYALRRGERAQEVPIFVLSDQLDLLEQIDAKVAEMSRPRA